MPVSPENFKTSQELRRELAALKLRLAFQEAEERAQAEARSRAADPALEESLRRLTPRAQAALRRGARRARARRAITQTLPRAGRIAAAALLVFYIGLSTAVATIDSVRVSFANFIMRIGPEYAELGFDDASVRTIEIPAEWCGFYFPAYIPEGFVFYDYTPYIMDIEYRDSAGNRFMFSECGPDTYSNIDTEDSDLSFVQLHGTRALVAEREGRTFVTWSIDNRYFIVRLEGAREEAVRIAESVRMIK